jgi:hypothetical protein
MNSQESRLIVPNPGGKSEAELEKAETEETGAESGKLRQRSNRGIREQRVAGLAGGLTERGIVRWGECGMGADGGLQVADGWR